MKALEHEAHAIRAQRSPRVLVELRERAPGELDVPFARAVEAREQPEQRRLPAPRRPEDDDDLAASDLEVDAVEHGQRLARGPARAGAGVALGQVARDDHRRIGSRSRRLRGVGH